MPGSDHKHVVVFDVNVWLDVARIFGPRDFTWNALTEFIVQHSREPVPSHSVRGLDSAIALAHCSDGKFAGGEPLQVWTGSHLDNTLIHKLTLPATEPGRSEDSGFGWSKDEAEGFVAAGSDELVWEMTGGTTTGDVGFADSTPPLDHEDGMVYRTALLAGDDPATRYLVTNDVAFRRAELRGDVTRLFPYEWVQMVRRSQQLASLSKLRPFIN